MSFYEVLMYILNENDHMELLNDSYFTNLAAAVEDIEERTGKSFDYQEVVKEIEQIGCASLGYPFVIRKHVFEA